MPSRPNHVARCRTGSWLLWLLLMAGLATAQAVLAATSAAQIQVLTQAATVNADTPRFPVDQAATTIALPDDWATSRPGRQGSVWYRSSFDLRSGADLDEVLALYIERACGHLEVQLNGHRLLGDGRPAMPLAGNCNQPRLITLPDALLITRGNVIDLRLQGHALERVASRQRTGGLSLLKVGPHGALAAEHADRLFWSITVVQVVGLLLALFGCVMVGLGWLIRRKPYVAYLGWLSLGWALMSLRLWSHDLPGNTEVVELVFCSGFALIVALAVQFLLSHAGVRERWVEAALALQLLLMPATLLVAGPDRLFVAAGVWYALLASELAVACVLYLGIIWRRRKPDFWPMAAILSAVMLVVLLELGTQYDLLPRPRIELFQFTVPLLLIGIGVRLLQVFACALQSAEAGRNSLEGRVQEITAEIERNFAQLAELRVEQVTEKERKRIAGDLHDDLGAKLLTIVHTSDSERISSLAREALEEMRLSVRGLTGKPMRLADALADWRAEIVLRLGQANIEVDWRGPSDEIEHLLPARGFVQTTRILREAVSNIIKHSGASHCKVRCAISEHQFGLTVQDNGRGIPMELDGKLDRGHGMSSMKHRAKQMQGQCLVESGPGYGTVIRLTLPL